MNERLPLEPVISGFGATESGKCSNRKNRYLFRRPAPGAE